MVTILTAHPLARLARRHIISTGDPEMRSLATIKSGEKRNETVARRLAECGGVDRVRSVDGNGEGWRRQSDRQSGTEGRECSRFAFDLKHGFFLFTNVILGIFFALNSIPRYQRVHHRQALACR